MRRSLAGMLFGIAYLFGCVAIAGFLLQHVAFSPDNTADSAYEILGDPRVVDEVASLITDATAAQLAGPGASQQQVEAARLRLNKTIHDVAAVPAGARLMAEVIADAHSRMIGETEGPVRVTPQQLVQITRHEAAAALPELEIPVQRVTALSATRTVLAWLVPIGALATLLFLVLGFLAHPDRAELTRTLGFGLIILAGVVALSGYVIPKFVPPLLTDSVWARVPPGLADSSLPVILALVVVLVVGGLLALAAAARSGRNRRWSTPISTYRYREERSWS